MDEPPKKQSRTRRKTTYKGADKKKTSGLTPRTPKQKELNGKQLKRKLSGTVTDLSNFRRNCNDLTYGNYPY